MIQPPLCSTPDINVEAPDFLLPENACDCHFHIFDEPSQQVSPRTYSAPKASLDDLLQLHNTLGFTRSVVVQPSIYGTDNRTTLSAVKSTRMTKAIATSPVDLQALARKVSEVGWHLQLLVDVSTFDDLEKTVQSLKVPVVFDHMGHMPAYKGVNEPGFQQLLRLLGEGSAWVKLSGVYRLSDGTNPDCSDVDDIVDALVRTNPDRLLWGSDWPHPHVPHAMPNDTHLLNLLAKWVPNTQLRNRILVDNPENLYKF